MTYTDDELYIIRDWLVTETPTDDYGGFINPNWKESIISDIEIDPEFQIDQYTIIGFASWSGYENGAEHLLLYKHDQLFQYTIWYSPFSDDASESIVEISIKEWIECVNDCEKFNESMCGV